MDSRCSSEAKYTWNAVYYVVSHQDTRIAVAMYVPQFADRNDWKREKTTIKFMSGPC